VPRLNSVYCQSRTARSRSNSPSPAKDNKTTNRSILHQKYLYDLNRFSAKSFASSKVSNSLITLSYGSDFISPPKFLKK